MKRALVLVTLVGGLLPISWAWAAGTPIEADSLSRVLELNLAKEAVEQLRGDEVTSFKLYTAPEKSVLAWWLGKVLYLYPINGSDHAARAAQLFEMLSKYGLDSFVAERKVKRLEGFNQVTLVRAIQLASGSVVTAGRTRQSDD